MSDTILGKWAVRLIIIFFVLFGVFMLLVASGQRGGNTFMDNLWLSIPMSIAALCAISSFVAGSISIVKGKERSIFVYFATAIGFFVLLFLSGEFLFPHQIL